MFSTRIRTLIRQQWAGLLALFLVLTGGTALATHPGGQDTISTADIIDTHVRAADIGTGEVRTEEIANGQVASADIGDGAVKSADIANGQVTADDLATNSVRAHEVADGQVKSPEIGNGQVQAEDLAPGVAPGASGARAWGLVNDRGDLARSKQITSVSHPATGVYCVNPAPGIEPDTSVLLVSLPWDYTITSAENDGVAHVEWRHQTRLYCGFDEMEVVTYIGRGTAATGGEFDAGGFDLDELDQGFTFVIP